MYEIRIHGRGGQGAVTTGQLMAIAAFYDGKFTQTFPRFGVERAGAPVETYVRIDDEFINLRSQVYEPDMLLVLDASLITSVDVTKGLKKGGLIVVNTDKKPDQIGIKGDYKVKTMDATSIAMEIFKRPIVNTPVLGSFSAITGLMSLESLKKAVDEKFESKGQKICDLNKKAIEKLYNKSKKS